MKIWVELTSALFQRFVICYHGGEDRSSWSVSDPDSMFCCDCIASSDFCFLFPYLLNLLPIHRSYSWVSRAFSFPPWCFCCLSLFFIYSFFSLQDYISELFPTITSSWAFSLFFFVIKQQYKADLHKCDSGFACCSFYVGRISHEISKCQLAAPE